MVMATWDDIDASTRGETVAAPAVMLRGIARGIRGILRQARRRHDRRKAAAQLLTMDAHLLRDINLSRSDVLAMMRDPDGDC